MSTMSEEARSKAKSKVERLVRSDPHARVDASNYAPDGPMDAGVQTGERPISRRQFKRGGKVAGESAPARADRKPRANGGRALTADSLINRDVKAANEQRDGTKHVGGFKKGGRAHKDMGGLALPNWADAVSRKSGGRIGKMIGGAMSPQDRMGLQQRATIPPATDPRVARPGMAGAPQRPGIRPGVMMRKDGGKVHGPSCACAKCGGGRVGKKGGGAINDGTRPVAGRLARKGGGRAKKGTNVNIIITQPQPKPAMPMPPAGIRPPGAPPVGMGQGMPPAGTAPMPPPGAQAIPPAGPLMQRATGGRANDGKLAKPGAYPIDAGAGGGLGRLEKAERAARG